MFQICQNERRGLFMVRVQVANINSTAPDAADKHDSPGRFSVANSHKSIILGGNATACLCETLETDAGRPVLPGSVLILILLRIIIPFPTD
jgi:hypothetical protein